MGKKEVISRIARERMEILFGLARKEFKEHPERSNRYVELSLKIGKRTNTPIPRELKKNYCKKCGAYLKEGVNSKLRISDGKMNVSCGECGAVKKISLTRKSLKKSQGRKKK